MADSNQQPARKKSALEEVEYLDKVSIRVNFKLVGQLALLLLFVIVCSLVSRRYFLGQNKAVQRSMAQKSYEKGDVLTAIRKMKAHLKEVPSDDEARLELFGWLETSEGIPGQRQEAYQVLADYIVNHPDDRKLRIRVIELGLTLNRYNEVLNTHLANVKEQFATDGTFREYAAFAHLSLGHIKEAVHLYCLGITNAPEDEVSYVELIRILRQSNQTQSNYAELAGLLKSKGVWQDPEDSKPSNDEDDSEPAKESSDPVDSKLDDQNPIEKPTVAEYYRSLIDATFTLMSQQVKPTWKYELARWNFEISTGSLSAAAGRIQELLELHPQEPRVLIAGIRTSIMVAADAKQSDETQRAIDQIAAGLELAKRSIARDRPILDAFPFLAQLENERGNIQAAISAFRKGRDEFQKQKSEFPDEFPKDKETQLIFVFEWGLANSLIRGIEGKSLQERKEVEAELKGILEKFKKIGVNPGLIEFLEGRQQQAEENWALAVRTMENARSQLGEVKEALRSLDLSLLQCHTRLGNPDARVSVLNRALREEPDWGAGRILLAETLAAMGLEEQALVEYSKSIAFGPVPASIIRLLIRQQLKLPAKSRDWSVIERALASLEKRSSDDTTVVTLRSEVLFQQKRFDEADRNLRDAISRGAVATGLTEAHLMLTLARTDVTPVRKQELVDEILNDYEKKAGDKTELRLMRGEAAFARKAEDLGDQIRALSVPGDSYTSDEKTKLFRGFAEIATAGGEFKLARELWERASAEEPNDVEPLIQLANLATRERDRESLVRITERVRAIEGEDGANSEFLTAFDLLQRAEALREEAKGVQNSEWAPLAQKGVEILRRVTTKRSLWAEAYRLMGMAQHQLGSQDEAFAALMRAFELGDRAEITQQMLVDYLSRRGRDEEVLVIVERIEKASQMALSESMTRKVAAAEFRLRMFDQALVRLDSKNSNTTEEEVDATDVFMKAQIRIARGETGPEIETMLADVTRMTPSRPQSWYQRIAYLWGQGKHAEANAVIEEIRKQVPAEPKSLVHLTLAICFDAMDDPEKADAEFEIAHGGQDRDIRSIYEHVSFCIRRGRLVQSEKLLSLVLDPDTKVTNEQRGQALRLQAQLRGSNTTSYSEFEEAMVTLGMKKELAETSVEDLQAQLLVLSRSRIRRDNIRQARILAELASRNQLNLAGQLRYAQVLEMIGEWTTALARLNDLTVSDGENPEVYATLLKGAIPRLKQTFDARLLSRAQSAADRLQLLEPDRFRTVRFQAQLFGLSNQAATAAQLLQDYLDGTNKSAVEGLFVDVAQSGRLEFTIAALGQIVSAENDPEAYSVLTNVVPLVNSGAINDVVRILAPFLRQANIRSSLRSELIRLVGITLEQLGDLESAETALKNYLADSNSFDASLVLAAFKARRQQVRSALEILQPLEGGGIPSATIARSYAAAIRVGNATPEQRKWVVNRIGTLRDAAVSEQEKAAIEVSLADLYILASDYQSALELYQRILAVDPQNVVALNNLAWLFSFDEVLRGKSTELINQAISKAGPLPLLVDTAGVIHINRGETKKAIDYLLQATGEAPSPDLWFHLAIAYALDKNIAESRKAWEQARATGFETNMIYEIERGRYQSAFDVFMGVE